MSASLDVAVTATGRQGDGIARWQDQTVFIPGALAGDIARIAPPDPATHRARLLDIVTPSPDRVAPSCPHFPACGGCRMQHLDLATYAAWKRDFVMAALHHHSLTPERLDGPLISPPHSRRRATFAAQRRESKVILGFNRAASREVIDLALCPVLRPELVALLPGLRSGLADYLGSARGCDVRLTSLADGCDLVIIGGPEPELHEREILAALAHTLDLARISWRKWDRSADEPIAQRKPLRVAFRHGTVDFPPGAFLQATQEGETALTDAVTAAIGPRAPVADLFCGLGTFALSLSPRRLTALDSDGAAVASLRDALRARTHATVGSRNLAREPMTAAELELFAAVIFDPPRDGAKAQAQHLAQSRVPRIIAVSCDLTAFCRDGKILQTNGYRLTQLTLVDQFLWSTHIELVGVFVK